MVAPKRSISFAYLCVVCSIIIISPLGDIEAVIRSWIYNYLFNQCLSPCTDVVSSNLDQGEVYNIMW